MRSFFDKLWNRLEPLPLSPPCQIHLDIFPELSCLRWAKERWKKFSFGLEVYFYKGFVSVNRWYRMSASTLFNSVSLILTHHQWRSSSVWQFTPNHSRRLIYIMIPTHSMDDGEKDHVSYRMLKKIVTRWKGVCVWAYKLFFSSHQAFWVKLNLCWKFYLTFLLA